MKARGSGKLPALAAMLLAIHLQLSSASVSFGSDTADIRRWEKNRDIGSLALALRDNDSEIRARAAEALGNIGDRQAVPPLIEALGDGISAVREAAAKGLENSGEPLGRLIADSLGGSAKAGEALAAWNDSRTISPLLKALRARDPNVSEAAAKTLGRIGDPRAVEPLITSLEGRPGNVREAAAWALEKIGDRRAVVPLIKSLKDGNPDVRAAAAWALGKLGDRRAVTPLIKSREDIHPFVREAATWSLGRIGDEETVDPMVRSLEDEYYKVRIAAAWSLGNPGDGRAVGPLIRALVDNDKEVRKGSAWSLGKLGDRRAVQPLIRAMGDLDPEVREAMASSLEKLGENLGRRIQESLSGSDEGLEELSRRKDPGSADALVAILKSSDGNVRRAAAAALGRLGDPRAVDGLVAMAGRWNLRDRIAATRALMGIDPKDTPGYPAIAARIMTSPASLAYLFGVVCLGATGVFVSGRIARPGGRRSAQPSRPRSRRKRLDKR